MDIVKRFGINTKGNDYICGDIHGCFSKLQSILDTIGFDEEVDRLFSVGDLVDRGPESRLALEWLDKPWFHAVRGNHEDMAIQYYSGLWSADNYILNGGIWFAAMTDQEQIQYVDAFNDLPIVIELDTPNGKIGIVHADCTTNDWGVFVSKLKSGDEDITEKALWSRHRVNHKHNTVITGIDRVVVGHTVQKKTKPLRLGNVVYIDSGAVFEKPSNDYGFTIFDVGMMDIIDFSSFDKEVV